MEKNNNTCNYTQWYIDVNAPSGQKTNKKIDNTALINFFLGGGPFVYWPDAV